MKLIENEFKDFLNPQFFYQDIDNHAYYFNSKYNIWFFHDFDKWHSLYEQLPAVEEKYRRRIDGFFCDIKEPTLFIRYISSEKELNQIEKNYSDLISSVIKKFNPDNDILFIANTGINSDVIKIYNCEKDIGDSVARHPFEKNSDLKLVFENAFFEGRNENIKYYERKMRTKNSKIKKIDNKIRALIKQKLYTEFCFDRQIRRT